LIDKVSDELIAHYPQQFPRCKMLFEGRLTRKFTRECTHSTTVRDEFYEIRINLKGEGDVDLKQAIHDNMNETEVFGIDEKYDSKLGDGDNRIECSTCSIDTEKPVKLKTTKVTTPSKLPRVLSVFVVRYEQGSLVQRVEPLYKRDEPLPAATYQQVIQPQKILAAVTYEEVMNFVEHNDEGTTTAVIYDLHSCVLTVPDRSLRIGHFKGYFKYNGKWYLSDDLTVTNRVNIRTHVDINEVFKHKTVVYLLTYIRRVDANVKMSSSSPLSSSSSSHNVDDTAMIVEQPISLTDTLVVSTNDGSSNAVMDASTHSSLVSTVIIPLSLASTAVPQTLTTNNTLDDLDLDEL